MIQKFNNFQINTNGQKLYEFTDQTTEWIKKNKFKNGIVNLSIQHTSASLIIQENADPDVQTDLINYFNKLAPMDNKLYVHTTEGKDDNPVPQGKHIKVDDMQFMHDSIVSRMKMLAKIYKEKGPEATVDLPEANDQSEVASVSLPIAKDTGPIDLGFSPKANDDAPGD